MKNLKKEVWLNVTLIILELQIISGQNLPDGGSMQSIVRLDSVLLTKLTMNRSLARAEKENYSTIEGDPYLYRDFAPGEIILKTGEKIPLYLRFNIYTHLVQFRQGNEIFALLNHESVSSVLIDTIRFTFTSFLRSAEDDKLKAYNWFILKKDGKLKLLVMKNLQILSAEGARGYQPPTNTRFILLPDSYYLELEGKSAKRIESKQDLLTLLADKSSDVMEFMNTNKLGVKKVKHLSRIVEYYNNLE